jgi:O-antigen/teichoic acid export membrane protein
VFVGLLRLGVAGAVWTNFVLAVGMVALMVGLLGYVGAWGRPSFDRSLWRRTGRFAIPAHCGNVLSYLNYRIDQFIIAVLLPPEQLGFYVIAVGLAERLWIPTGAVATALLPHLTNSREHDPALSAVIARHVMLWTGAACLLVFALADVVVRVLYSSAFAPTVAPLRWLLPGIFTLAAGKLLVAEMLAREKIRFTVWVGATATLVNVAGNLVLVPRMGISGSALASSISYSLVSLIVTWYYVRETGVPWTTLVPRRSDLLAYIALWRRFIHPVSIGSGIRGDARP